MIAWERTDRHGRGAGRWRGNMGKTQWGVRAFGIFLLWAAAAVALPAQTFTTLHRFCAKSGCKDGDEPYYGVLIQATDGNLYGTTVEGGYDFSGTIFNISTSGTFTTLYSFCSHNPNYNKGLDPFAGLVQGPDGSFYGTTQPSYGSVFLFTPGGVPVLKTLHKFDSADGNEPEAALVLGANGDFYGTTYASGANDDGTTPATTQKVGWRGAMINTAWG
jgi:uncharacterized repeat protein (TIGR03803 family)